MRRLFILSVFAIFTIHQVYAQADSVTLVTDRPTQSASAYTIAKGTWQIETGFQYSNQETQIFATSPVIRQEIINFNTTLIRFGITKNLELNFAQSLIQGRVLRDDVVTFEDTNASPTSLGLRWQLMKENGILPQVSLLTTVSASPFVSGATGSVVEMRLNMQHNLNDGWSIGYNIGLSDWEDFLYTFVIGKSLSPKLSAFVEAYGFLINDGLNPHSLDYGFTYLLNDDMQLDVYGGNALNDWAADYIFGLGFSVRIPGN